MSKLSQGLVFVAVLAVVVLSACGETSVETKPTPTAVTGGDGQPLGSVQLPTSCSAQAQPVLEQALALLHNMTYVEADRLFGEAAALDPECGLAYWGQAMTRVHPLWPDVPSEQQFRAGQELLEQALAAGNVSDRERAYISALQAYYRPGATSSERERLQAFLDGWKAVHGAHPDDPEAKLFYALALMATAEGSDKSYEKQRTAGALAQAVLEQIPDHPGAHHYVIHAYDFAPLAERALTAARSYGEVAPENSHALHMTSHIFTRLGLWPESIEYNERAADASMERNAVGAISMHRMHALDYVVYGYLQTANDEQAVSVLEQLKALEPPFQNHAATAYAFAAVPARIALERQDWSAASKLQPGWPAEVPWDQYPHLVAIPEFARALGAARGGEIATAETAIARLQELQRRAAALPGAYDWGTQVAIQAVTVEAWLELERGDHERALELMAEAAEMEQGTEKNPVTPGAVLPATELYGDMLMEAGRFEAAKAQYDRALERSPNRFNSLYGAGLAAEKAGDAATATALYGRLLSNCPSPSGAAPRLRHARAFVDRSSS